MGRASRTAGQQIMTARNINGKGLGGEDNEDYLHACTRHVVDEPAQKLGDKRRPASVKIDTQPARLGNLQGYK